MPFDVEAGTVHVVAYNDLPMLERILAQHRSEIAALVIEPVIENLAIVVPDEGYLAGVRALCDQHGVVLIFDEVKTGLTAGPAGAAQRLGVQPDLITLAKSIGGGFPLAAFGGKREVMEVVVDGRMAHFGTYNGNPLVMAAARAVDELCTQEALDGAEAINLRALNAIAEVISEYELPAHTVGLGVKGCITWSTTPVRNYRDYKATDFGAAELSWLWGAKPERPHATWSRRAVACLVGPHQRRHGPSRRRLHRAGPSATRLRARGVLGEITLSATRKQSPPPD